jgi:error-prone DNA polymerase
MSAYAELAVTTNFSFLRGASHPGEYVARAAELNLKAIGIADRNTMAGVVRAYVESKEHPNLKLLVGARLVTEDGFEAIAYPTGRAAYGRLCRLLSTGNLRARKGDCLFGFDELLATAEGQVLIALPAPRLTKAFAERMAALREAAPGRAYLAAAHRYRADEPRRLGRLAELAERAGVPLVAVADALYHAPERRPLHDVVTCIREKCTIREAGLRLEKNAERHLKGADEMARLFASYPDALARTLEIAEACNFSLAELRYEYPDEPVPPEKTPQQHLEGLTWEGARRRYPAGIPDSVQKLLREEFALIAEMDYAPYFLTVHDLVVYARERGILCQGRGSAANSAVCFCLGVTSVDPAKSSLLFARFISKDRDEPPDIDVDFEHERREEVIQYLYRRYGRERAAICSAVIHYRPRLAIREVGKALGLTPDVTAALAGTAWGYGDELPDEQVRQAGLDPDNPEIRRAVGLANELIGFPRHLTQHVGGFVLTRSPLIETVPVGNAAMEDRTFIEWDKDDIDALGIMKVDVLALGMLSCIRRALDLLEAHYRRDFPSIADLPQEAPEVYEMLCRADSVGVFQVESRAQMAMLPRLKPREFYDLVVEVALVRPGPIQGEMVHPYLRRRAAGRAVVFPAPHPDHGPPDELEEVLKKTYGVPLFQEQAMRIAMVAAKFSGAEADKLRRAMGAFRHAGKIHELREKFVGGMVRRGYPQEFAERCFRQIEGFSTYGFPESHAASFALLVYASAWIKRFHPDVFCAALLNSQPMGFYQPAQIVRDAREHGVEVRPPDVNHSDWDCTLEPAAEPSEALRFAVRLGLRQVAGLRRAEAERIVAGRGRGNGFHGVDQVGAMEGVSRATLERLAEADAFRSMGLDRRLALWAVKGLDGGCFAGDGEQPDLFAPHLADGLFAEPPPALPALSLSEHVAEDYVTTGLSLKAHPCAFFRPMLRGLGAVPAAARHEPSFRAGAPATVAGLVLIRQRPSTAKGVVFLTLEDETGSINVIVRPDVFEENRRAAMTARFLAVRGHVQRQGLVMHVVAESFLDLTPELRRLREGCELPPQQAIAGEGSGRRELVKSRNFC